MSAGETYIASMRSKRRSLCLRAYPCEAFVENPGKKGVEYMNRVTEFIRRFVNGKIIKREHIHQTGVGHQRALLFLAAESECCGRR